MVQTHSLATINQEIENPPNALERQVQTLAMAIKRLTQRNKDLEEQLNQRNERRPNNQCNEQDNDECNDSHPPDGRLSGKGRSRRKQCRQQEGPTGHANDEKEDGYDDEHNERAPTWTN